jgi:hypothetical protein
MQDRTIFAGGLDFRNLFARPVKRQDNFARNIYNFQFSHRREKSCGCFPRATTATLP